MNAAQGKLQAGNPIADGVPVANEPARSPYGTWLDEDLRLIRDEGASLLQIVLLTLNATPHRRDFKEYFERRVDCILANALRAHFFRENGIVAYHRGNNDYQNRPKWLSGSGMRGTVDRLASAGFIGMAEGKWGGGDPNFGKGYAATYWLEPPLRELMAFCNVTLRTVGKPVPPPSSVVKLRAGEGEEKRLLRFDETNETQRWIADLDNYNQFADQHDVDISALDTLLEKKLVTWWNKKLAEGSSKQPLLVAPEFFNRHVHRIFNDGRFDHGGRLYGPWYQYAPKWIRRSILIDDQETVELDYSGMSVRMLYHLTGIEYDGDPYEIPELTAYALATGRGPDHFRGAIKKLVQAMLNNEEDDCRPEMISLEESFRSKYTRTQVRDMILAHHEPIADMFGTGVGKELQRLDSDIALEVVASLMNEGILCLPIHDSFIVIADHGERLNEQMIVSYRNRLAFDPIIKDH